MTDWAKDDLMDPPYPEDDKPSRKGGVRVIRHVIALSLVLVTIGGLATAGWFGFKTWRARGSEGLAPVIQAEAGPTRVRPEQPGGLVIPHQDRLVLHDLNGGGASISAESLLPPPEEPLPRPQVALAVAEVATPAYAPAAGAPADEPVTAAPAQVAAVIAAPPVPEPSTVAEIEPEVEVPAAAVPVVEQVAQANEPPPELVTRPAAEATPTPEFVSVASLMRAHRIQLAAVDSEESARRAWLRYQGLYQDVLGDLSLLVQQVEVNNRTYFRVQGGPLEAGNAGQICQAIKSRGADCLVVRPQR
jgi:hypothetical protein